MKYATEKAVIVISFLVGVAVLSASIISMYNDFSTGKSFEYLMTDIVFFVFGVVLTGGALRIYKKLITLSTIADDLFEELVFTRLRPVLEEVAYNTVELSEVKAELEKLTKKVDSLESFKAQTGFVGDVSFYMRTIIVSFVYVCSYLLMLNYYTDYTPYLFVVLYIIWWAFITREFKLFSRFEAWLVMGIPVLIVPAMSIVIQNLLGIPTLMGIIFSTSLLYAYMYYLYAKELSLESGKQKSDNQKESYQKKKEKPNFFLRKTSSFVSDIIRWLKS